MKKYNLPERELQVKACKELLNYYQRNKEIMYNCPLCKAVKSDCNKCMWMIETKKDCISQWFVNVTQRSVDFLRKSKPLWFRIIRSYQLRKWIKKYDY